MKEKKTAKANLESKRGLFMEIGLIIVLVLVYIAFEQKSAATLPSVIIRTTPDTSIDDLADYIRNEKAPLPPPPAPQPTLLKSVDDDKEVKKDVVIDAEPKPDEPIPDLPRPAIPAEPEPEEDIRFIIVEESPEYPGGDGARLSFLRSNIKYPQSAREIGIQGTVYVEFVVEKDGSISNVSIIRGIGGGCDEEAVRVVKMMPKWNRGKQRGKEVRVSFKMPIKFTLQD